MGNPLQKYERLSEGVNLATSIGRSGLASRLGDRLSKFSSNHSGLDTSGVAVENFPNWESMGPGSSDLGRSSLMHDARQRFKGKDNAARRVNEYGIKLNKSIEGKMKQGLISEIDPSLQQAQTLADRNMGRSAVSATDEQGITGRIVAQVRTGESSRMARIGQGLGFGNSASSPAAQALASEAADDADRAVVSAVRDMQLQTHSLNREQERMDIDLATRIATQRFALKNGNSKSLIDMQGEVAETLASLFSRDQTLDMLKKQMEDANSESLGDRIGQWGGIASNLAQGVGSAMTGFGSMGGGGGGGMPAPSQGSSYYGSPNYQSSSSQYDPFRGSF